MFALWLLVSSSKWLIIEVQKGKEKFKTSTMLKPLSGLLPFLQDFFFKLEEDVNWKSVHYRAYFYPEV